MTSLHRDLLTVIGWDIAAAFLRDFLADCLWRLDQLAFLHILALLDRNLLACGEVLHPGLVAPCSLPVESTLLLVVDLAGSPCVRLVGGLIGCVAFLLVSSVAFLLLALHTFF